jgi:hypothetical protein
MQQDWGDYQRWLSYHGIDSYWEGPQFPPTADSVLVVSAPKDGLTYQVFGGRHKTALLPQRCKYLTDEGACGIFGQPNRPQICADWPSQPWELLTLDQAGQLACGYQFVPSQTPGGDSLA